MLENQPCNLTLVSEAEFVTDWQQRYLNGDTPWDKGYASPPLDELIHRLGVSVLGEGEVWVPGCGSGHDVRRLAEHGIKAVGLDIAPAAIELAKSHPRLHNERYELMNFLDPSQRIGRQASAIWEHTCFCAIDPSLRDDYARSAGELLAPGGTLAGVFFLNPRDDGDDMSGPPFPSTQEAIDVCFGPWFERVAAWQPESAYPGREGREWLAVYKRLTQGSVL